MDVTSMLQEFGVEKIERAYQATGFSNSFILKDKTKIVSLTGKFKKEGFYLETITAFDKKDGVKMIYVFSRYDSLNRNAVYFDAAYNEEIQSVTEVYPAAIWFESEVYDMFGNTFKGHPCLKRLLTPEGFKGFPLLKSWTPEEE